MSEDLYRLKNGSIEGAGIGILAGEKGRLAADRYEVPRILAITDKNSPTDAPSFLYKTSGRDYWDVANEVGMHLLDRSTFGFESMSEDRYKLKNSSMDGAGVSIKAYAPGTILAGGKDSWHVVAVTDKSNNEVSFLYKKAGLDYWGETKEVQIQAAGKSIFNAYALSEDRYRLKNGSMDGAGIGVLAYTDGKIIADRYEVQRVLAITDKTNNKVSYLYKEAGLDYWSVAKDVQLVDFSTIGTPVSVNEKTTLVTGFKLSQNYPNPFNPSTTIKFELEKEAHVTAKVFNMLGQEVRVLTDDRHMPGAHELRFDASTLASGVYIYNMWVDSKQVASKKMILEK